MAGMKCPICGAGRRLWDPDDCYQDSGRPDEAECCGITFTYDMEYRKVRFLEITDSDTLLEAITKLKAETRQPNMEDIAQ